MDTGSQYEVLVVGGGMAGCAAATAAARLGSRTLLVESFGFLGGWATAALVNPFMSHCTSDGKPLVAGLFDEILDRLSQADGLIVNSFDPECMKLVLQEIVIESGAAIRLHTFFESARAGPDGRIVAKFRSKSGMEEVECLRLIDCTGDGDAAVSLGAHFETGDQDGLPQAATLMFDVGGVDLARALAYVRDHPDQMLFPKFPPDADAQVLASGIVCVAGYYDLVSRARDNGEYEAPGDLIFYIGRPTRRTEPPPTPLLRRGGTASEPPPSPSFDSAQDVPLKRGGTACATGEVTFNTTHVGHVDGTKAEDLTRAEIEGRRQMLSVVAFAREYVPGFEKAYLLRCAAHVGIRETRRILGDYVFTAEDVTRARKFEDCICRLAYPVDVHSGQGKGYTKGEDDAQEKPVHSGTPPPGDWYEIPYRCLLPDGLENVLVAGRCVSSTHAGHGAIRIMPACVAMGEAAGAAAALSIHGGISPRELSIPALSESLRARGALV